MNKCNSYHEYNIGRGFCFATRECDPCDCQGDKTRCNFYDEVRTQAQRSQAKFLNTAEMYLAAQNDGETYHAEYNDTYYSRDKGFWSESLNTLCETPSLIDWMELVWRKQDSKRKLTREQAEKEFGVKIVD